jgi:hypothetical protein
MKIKSFFMALALAMISPLALANSSWDDIKGDLKCAKDSLVESLSSSTQVSTFSFPAINSADIFVGSIPAWASVGLWYKGFKCHKPFQSTKTMFNLKPEMSRMECVKLALNNKAYGGKLAFGNSAKVLGAAYLTGFAWHLFGKNE